MSAWCCAASAQSSALATPSGSGSRRAGIHTSCAVVAAPTFDRAVRQVVLDGRVRQAEAVGGRLSTAAFTQMGAPDVVSLWHVPSLHNSCSA